MKKTIKFGDNSCYINVLHSLSTNLSNFYFNTEECFYCYLSKDDKADGYVQFKIENFFVHILVINTKNDEDKKELMSAIISFADQNHLSIDWRIISDVIGDKPSNKDFDLADQLGFSKGSVLHIFKSYPDVYDNLSKIVNLFERISKMMERSGFVLSSFKNLGDDARKYICENPEDEFEDYLESGKYISGKFGTFNEDMSFVALKDNKPVAYTVVRSPTEKRCIFENNSVAKSYKRSGVLAMVWGASLKMLLDSKLESITFAVYENNKEAYPMVKERLKTIISEEKLQINYYRIHEHNDECLNNNGSKM